MRMLGRAFGAGADFCPAAAASSITRPSAQPVDAAEMGQEVAGNAGRGMLGVAREFEFQ